MLIDTCLQNALMQKKVARMRATLEGEGGSYGGVLLVVVLDIAFAGHIAD